VVTQVSVYLTHTTYQRFDDKKVVLAAVSLNGRALLHAADRLKSDKTVVVSSYRTKRLGVEACG